MGSTIAVTAADGHVFGAYAAGAQDAPRALVLCHDVGGLCRHIRHMCDQVAALGFQVIAPSLFDRVERDVELSYRPGDIVRGTAIAGLVPAATQTADIAAAAALFGQARIGVLGFGWGGLAAWHAAAQLRALRAAVAFYPCGLGNARQETPLCPVQLHFGAWDKLVPLADSDAIRHAQPQVEIEVYFDAGHFFTCGEREEFSPEANEAARDNMLAFLRRHL